MLSRFLRTTFFVNILAAVPILLLFSVFTLWTHDGFPFVLGLGLALFVSIAIWTIALLIGLLVLGLRLIASLATVIFDSPRPEPIAAADFSLWDDALDGPSWRRLPTR